MIPSEPHPQSTVYRTYRYRLYPTKRQFEALETQLGFCCDLYNAAQQERKEAWQHGVSIHYRDQQRQLTEIRHDDPLVPVMNCSTQQNALKRLDLAFDAFYRRCRAGEKPGYPRFRSRRCYDSLKWSFSGNAGGVAIIDRRLYLQGVGHVKVKWHRGLPATASLCMAAVVRRGRRWGACLSLKMAVQPAPSKLPEIGIDLGIATFAALSDGELITGPHSYRGAEQELRVAQRRVSRRKRGSKRQQKARAIVRRKHEHIASVRRDHAHKTSHDLVSRFGTICVEDLNILMLVRGMLGKHARDQGWGTFLELLRYKAESAGTRVIQVDPRHTSQSCSGCGVLVPKDLRCRVHECPHCGLVLDRDVNAARNILKLGLDGAVRRQREARGLCVA